MRVMLFFSVLFMLLSMSCTGENIKNGTGGSTGTVQNTSGTDSTEPKITVKNREKYSEYLVDPKYYSTNGGYYQSKYHDSIIIIVKSFIEKDKLNISEGTVGFYFDKKSTRTDRLFFGLDLFVKNIKSEDYGSFSVSVIKKYTMPLLNEVYKNRNILKESEVVGVVFGFKWTESGARQQVNIWIKEEDIILTYTGKITVNEMLQRSTITNTAGKVILLAI